MFFLSSSWQKKTEFFQLAALVRVSLIYSSGSNHQVMVDFANVPVGKLN